MALMIGPSFQSRADAIREILTDDPALRRCGVEILRASANETAIVVRARHRGRALSVEAGPRWREVPRSRLASAFRGEVLADAQATPTFDRAPRSWPPRAAPHRWRRRGERALRARSR